MDFSHSALLFCVFGTDCDSVRDLEAWTMNKKFDETEIVFVNKQEGNKYPTFRNLTVRLYGGSVEACVLKAREIFSLGSEWELFSATGSEK